MSLSQISVIVGEIEDSVAINLGDGGIGRLEDVVANLYTRLQSSFDFDRLFFVNDYGRNRRGFAGIMRWLWLLHLRAFAFAGCGRRLLGSRRLGDGGRGGG